MHFGIRHGVGNCIVPDLVQSVYSLSWTCKKPGQARQEQGALAYLEGNLASSPMEKKEKNEVRKKES